MTISTGVTAILQCAHRDHDGRLHGHSWEISAETSAEPFRDAVVLQARLEGLLRAWNHTTLPDELSSGEALAAAIADVLGDCTRVRVARPLERIYAEWTP